MKLALVLADATRADVRGTVSALGLGITQLTVERFPGQFHGGLVLIATPDAGDSLDHEFSLTLAGPGQSPQQFAVGAFKGGDPLEQVTMAHSFDMLIGAPGVYVFRIESGTASAEARLTVREAPKANPEGEPIVQGDTK